jgi:GDP-mannose 6-dehydrogenase
MGFITDVTKQIAAVVKVRNTSLTVAMRPQTTEQLIRSIFRSSLGERCDGVVELVFNSEFLREGSAIADYFAPPKILIGTLTGQPSPTMASSTKASKRRPSTSASARPR